MPGAGSLAQRVRALRSPKPRHDPWRAQGIAIEEERQADGSRRPAVTIFLTGAECPFACVYCDLWRYTLDGPTPPGALAVQLRRSLTEVAAVVGREELSEATLKLYNASNFFEPRAVPPGDLEQLLDLLAPYGRVVVESHPRLVDERCREFAVGLAARGGGCLEVAMGLETVHPEALPRLGKQTSVEIFDRAVATLRDSGLALRAFVLVGTPFVPAAEQLHWTLSSVEYALQAGAEQVSLILVRDGNGYLDSLATTDFQRPSLAQLEEALDQALRRQHERRAKKGAIREGEGREGVVIADLWDVERFSTCDACMEARYNRLERMNLLGELPPPVACTRCGSCHEL